MLHGILHTHYRYSQRGIMSFLLILLMTLHFIVSTDALVVCKGILRQTIDKHINLRELEMRERGSGSFLAEVIRGCISGYICVYVCIHI